VSHIEIILTTVAEDVNDIPGDEIKCPYHASGQIKMSIAAKDDVRTSNDSE
jgi:hypothetical protein